MENHILNTQDFTYEPFFYHGFSGSLYLATPKCEGLPKLLIKHENTSSACNEYMFSKLAELLCIHAPKVYLFDVDEKDERLFASPYVVGIEYIEGLRSFTLHEMNSKPAWQREYAQNYALAVICSQDDNVQMSMTPDGHIISYDYTECFYLPASATSCMNRDEDTRIEIIKRHLSSFYRAPHDILANAGATVLQKHLNKEHLEEVYPLYHDPMKRLIELTGEQIEAATELLYDIYPIEIGVYFEEYIKVMQAKIKSYLLDVSKH